MQQQELQQTYLKAVEENRALIYKVCYMYAEDEEHLKDLCQEVMANMWQGLGSYRGEARMSTWIYRLAINTCVSYLRHHGRSASNTVSLDEGAYDVADDSNDKTAMLKMMYELIAGLGKIDKAIVMLRLDEYSYDEISAITGLTRNNVASRLHRIKARLSKQIDK